MRDLVRARRAACQDVRWDRIRIQAFRQRLEQAGKPVKVAITATTRKLLAALNAMLAPDTDYRRAEPS